MTYLKVAVATVWPEQQSAAAAESAAFPVVETKTQDAHHYNSNFKLPADISG